MSDKQLLVDYFLRKYDKVTLSREEVAKELDIGVSTLDKRLSSNSNVPKYKKIAGRVMFPITSLADFLTNDLSKM
jgi:hypothetical protein